MAGVPWAMHVVGEDLEKTVSIAVDRTNEPIFDAFADHGALFARDGKHVGFHVRQDFLAEGDVEILCWPIGMLWFYVAEFQVIDTQILG
jgi:hypothetical protein